jgi:hypothetical protein
MHAAITSRMREIYSDMTENPTPSAATSPSGALDVS